MWVYAGAYLAASRSTRQRLRGSGVFNHLLQLQGLKVSPVQYLPALNSGMETNEKARFTLLPCFEDTSLEREELYYGGQGLTPSRILELAIGLVHARRGKSHPLTHLLIVKLCDGTVHEVVGDFKTLSSHPVLRGLF